MEPLLKEGDKIQVGGFVMLKDLDPGEYQITKVWMHRTEKVMAYELKSYGRGRRRKCFAVYQIDGWIRTAYPSENNFIKKIEK